MTPTVCDPRTCLNCACFARMHPDGTLAARDSEAPAVCRRNTPAGRWARLEVPLLTADGQPILNPRGKPQLEVRQVLQIGYPPVIPESVCFDGWRPPDTLPGEPAPGLRNGFGAVSERL